jgi:hypothetical protein
MTTTRNRKKFAVGAAIAGMAAPALLFFGTGIAQAAHSPIGPLEHHASVTTTQSPGHVLIQTEPEELSPPLVWGPFSNPLPIIFK